MTKTDMEIVQHPTRKEDEIRETILFELYQLHRNARGLTSARRSIMELKRLLKKNHGLSDKEIVSNLDYLVQSGWVIVEKEISEFTTARGTTRRQEKKYFKISDRGIDYFEGISKFQRVQRSFAGIKITNINGVTILGDGNAVVNTQHADLYKQLSLLSEVIRNNGQLSDEQKLNSVGDIETIKAQLMKTDPDKNIIKRAWEKLKPLATISGIITLFNQVANLIAHIL